MLTSFPPSPFLPPRFNPGYWLYLVIMSPRSPTFSDSSLLFYFFNNLNTFWRVLISCFVGWPSIWTCLMFSHDNWDYYEIWGIRPELIALFIIHINYISTWLIGGGVYFDPLAKLFLCKFLFLHFHTLFLRNQSSSPAYSQ